MRIVGSCLPTKLALLFTMWMYLKIATGIRVPSAVLGVSVLLDIPMPNVRMQSVRWRSQLKNE